MDRDYGAQSPIWPAVGSSYQGRQRLKNMGTEGGEPGKRGEEGVSLTGSQWITLTTCLESHVAMQWPQTLLF